MQVSCLPKDALAEIEVIAGLQAPGEVN